MLDTLSEALDDLTPAFPVEDGDWADVLARAAAPMNGSASIEVTSAPARLSRPPARRPRLTLAVVAAAAMIAALVSFWPFHESSAVLAAALAAIGRGPVTHVVLLDGGGSALVDLHTNTQTPVHAKTEVWFDPQRGTVILTSFRGKPTGSYLIPAGANGTATSSPVTTFVTGYRSQLRAHRYRITGSGTVAGTAVYWIQGPPKWATNESGTAVHKFVDQVAISKTTYKPMLERTLRDGHAVPQLTRRILIAETTGPQPHLFNRQPAEPPSWGYSPTSQSLTAVQIRARVRAAMLYPKRIGNLRLTWQGETPYTCCNSPTAPNLAGITLYYGPLNQDTGRGGTPGDPDYSGTYVSITEFQTDNAVVRLLGPQHFPTKGKVILDAPDVLAPGAGSTATLRAHGVSIIISGSSNATVIAAARALALGR